MNCSFSTFHSVGNVRRIFIGQMLRYTACANFEENQWQVLPTLPRLTKLQLPWTYIVILTARRVGRSLRDTKVKYVRSSLISLNFSWLILCSTQTVTGLCSYVIQPCSFCYVNKCCRAKKTDTSIILPWCAALIAIYLKFHFAKVTPDDNLSKKAHFKIL